MRVFLFEGEALLDIVEFLNFLGEHVSDDQNLLREALVLVDQDLLVLKVLVLFFLDLFCGFKQCQAKLFTAFL